MKISRTKTRLQLELREDYLYELQYSLPELRLESVLMFIPPDYWTPTSFNKLSFVNQDKVLLFIQRLKNENRSRRT